MTKDEELRYAFEQRDELLVYLSRQFPCHLCERLPGDPSDEDWPVILCIHGVAGQMSWHIHESRLHMFRHVPQIQRNHWDGHDSIERHKRLRACAWQDI